MRKQVFVLVGIIFSLQSSAQHFCGFDSLILSLKLADPMFDQKLAIRNEMISDWLDWRSSVENQSNIDPLLNQTNFVIPVVFHVVYDPADPIGVGSNVSYAQLQQGILLLNEQFAGIVPNNPAWGTDSHIQFCLAQDPWPFPGPDQIEWQDQNQKGVVRIPQMVWHFKRALKIILRFHAGKQQALCIG